MDIWDILGIKETGDKNELKNAYREKLKTVNPEDDQDGFMRLREAYEEALKHADSSLNSSPDEEKDERFPFAYNVDCREALVALDELYKDYNERIKEDRWRELFDRDEFIALDISEDSMDALVNYLMLNFLLPHNIWQMIVDNFDIKNRKKELCDKYPKDFIDFTIDNSENIDIINYYLFDYDVDNERIDEFIKTYLTLNSAIRRNQPEDAKKLMKKLESFDIYHPYMELAKIRMEIQNSNEDNLEEIYEEGYEKAKQLSEDCPDDFNITSLCGDIALMLKKYDEAEQYYNILKCMEPDSVAIKVKFADLAYYKEDYTASRDAYMELLRNNNYENTIRAGMLRANLALIEKYYKELEINPNDTNTKIELAWSLYQSYRFAEAVEVLDSFEPDSEKKFEYYNVKGRSHLCLLDYDNAVYCFYCWKEAIETLGDDESEETLKKKKRLPYVNFLIADCFIKKKRYDEAEKYLEYALTHEHDEMILSYEALCELKYETEKYEECIGACEKLLDFGDKNYIAYDYMSKACFKLNYIKESIDACENAIRIYPYAADPYAQEIDIFIELGQYDTAKAIIERYKRLEIPSDRMVLCEGKLLRHEGKFKEAIEKLKKIENVDINDSDLTDITAVYYELASCFEKTNRFEEAIVYLNKAVKINIDNYIMYGRIGLLYRKIGNNEKAVDYLTKLIDKKPYTAFIFERGNSYRALGRLNEAVKDYERVINAEPGNGECHRVLGKVYEFLENYDRALLCYDNAIMHIEDENELKKLYIDKARALQCMCRYEEAGEMYRDYRDRFGVSYDYVYDYSTLLQRVNEVETAIAVIRDNISSFADTNEEMLLLRRLCTIYGEEGYVNLANETFRIIISNDPKDSKTYAVMGDVFRENGLYEDAIKCYNNAIKLDFEGGKNYYSDLVECELMCKSVSRANIKEHIRLALEKGEKAKTVIDYITLAKIYRLTKKYKMALNAVEDGLRRKRCFGCFYRSCHDIFYEKGRIYEAMKKYELAEICYKEALDIAGHSVLYEESLKRIDGK